VCCVTCDDARNRWGSFWSSRIPTLARWLFLRKTLGGLPRRRGRMTRLEDRQILVRDIEQACADGARLAPACALAGIDAGTLRRWKAGDGLIQGDRRPDADRPIPSHALSEAERARIIEIANEPRFADTPPARIVPALADEGSVREPLTLSQPPLTTLSDDFPRLHARLQLSPDGASWWVLYKAAPGHPSQPTPDLNGGSGHHPGSRGGVAPPLRRRTSPDRYRAAFKAPALRSSAWSSRVLSTAPARR
jgi:hypothetical protein